MIQFNLTLRHPSSRQTFSQTQVQIKLISQLFRNEMILISYLNEFKLENKNIHLDIISRFRLIKSFMKSYSKQLFFLFFDCLGFNACLFSNYIQRQNSVCLYIRLSSRPCLQSRATSTFDPGEICDLGVGTKSEVLTGRFV